MALPPGPGLSPRSRLRRRQRAVSRQQPHRRLGRRAPVMRPSVSCRHHIAATAVAAPISAAGTATRTTRVATTRGAPCPVSAKRAPNHMSTGNIATTARTPSEAAGNATAASSVSGAGQQPLTATSADESTCSPPNRLGAKYATSKQPSANGHKATTVATAARRRQATRGT